MVIDLTRDEKSTLFRFLGLYLGSSFILLVIIAWLFFRGESRMYYDLTISNMQNEASVISSKIVHAHMVGKSLDVSEVLSKTYSISLYDGRNKLLLGEDNLDIDFNKRVTTKNSECFLVDSSPQGHLGVTYIVVKEDTLKKDIAKLKRNILIIFIIAYTFIAFVGYILAKIFLEPIHKERERLNNFIKDSTHELNTPITAILMCTSSPNGVNEKNFRRINLSAKRVSEIYKDLTYLFLKDKNLDERAKVNLRLDEVLLEQLEYFDELAQKKKIEIVKDIKESSFIIDRESFIRVINNLISNAIKYNVVGGKIKVELNDKFLIVEDNGIGIEKSKQKDIFNRFYRANDVQGGFGIGLNIVKEICHSYGIKIEVNSQKDIGTKIKLYFRT